MRRGWLVGVLAALGALWLLALDAVWNITAGLINMEVHRWWLIPTTIAMTVITSVATGIVRYVDHKRRPHTPPTTPPLISAAGDSHVEVQHSQVGGHGNTLINVAVGSAEQLSPAVVDAPAGLHNLPNPSTVFVGRDLAAVEHTLSGGAGAIGQAVHGLGGVGKSELATHYAHAHPDRYRLRWWITADTVDNITLGLTELTQRLHPLPDLTTAAGEPGPSPGCKPTPTGYSSSTTSKNPTTSPRSWEPCADTDTSSSRPAAISVPPNGPNSD